MRERYMVLSIVVTITLFSSISSLDLTFAQGILCNGLEPTIFGTEGNDKIRGTPSDDVIVGLGGNDKINGNGGNDIICGGDGNDNIKGDKGDDVLIGGSGSDKINGGPGFDTCDYTSEDKKLKSCEDEFVLDPLASPDNIAEQIQALRNQLTEIMNQMTEFVIFWSDIKEIPEDIADGDADTLGGLGCSVDEIAKWNGETWQCSFDIAFSASPIFFHHSRILGTETQWAGIYDVVSSDLDVDKIALVMPTSGVLSNLNAKLGESGDIDIPRGGEKYTLTIIKNGKDETILKCIITEFDDFCTSGDSKISINAGETIVLKIVASDNAPLAIITSSVLFAGI